MTWGHKPLGCVWGGGWCTGKDDVSISKQAKVWVEAEVMNAVNCLQPPPTGGFGRCTQVI